MTIQIDHHPLLHCTVFTTRFSHALGEACTPNQLVDLMRLEAQAPLTRSEALRGAVRDMLRHGGYKPTGRGKPASEYLVRAADAGKLGAINAAVDACNVVSLHSGLPVSVVDLDRANAPFRIGIAQKEASFVFNPSGQEIKIGGLLCLHDAQGPCANAVKDAQRTKTSEKTTSTLSVIWGVKGFETQTEKSLAWYRDLLAGLEAKTEMVIRREA